ncbi:MAG: Pre-mRNA-splicing factor [Cirrosporium novae-zelandiae]|nr:MAG: Pre-mRNA-splicing factor [Cirrosporium novae-zelandiae]
MADVEMSIPAAMPSSSTEPVEDSVALTRPDSDSPTAEPQTSTEVAAPVKKTKKIIRRKKRPARPQVDPSTIKSEPPPQTGTIFNIWYNKWSGGDREDKYLSKTHAPNRCSISKDTGYTRADSITGSYFCLFFARGICPRGQECEYLHRLPTIHDLFNPNVDCFGRDKHSDYRDDMGGVGSFMRQNRTLYVGRIHVTDDIEEIVARHFAEWGEVERIRVLTARGVAFVTYSNEANSQFAKEAMAHQSLDHNEILNVRWATVDPNPQAQKREASRIEEQAAEAIRRALPAEFVAEIEGRDPEAVKRKRIEGSFGLNGYEAPDEVYFARHQVQAQQQQQQLEAPEETRLLEAGPASTTTTSQQNQQQQPTTTFFPTSTLLALKSHSETTAGRPAAMIAKPSVGGGPLVAYGSDDDDSD